MAIQNQGWAYVSGSSASGTPGGADTNIQFNNAGAFGGSSDPYLKKARHKPGSFEDGLNLDTNLHSRQ